MALNACPDHPHADHRKQLGRLHRVEGQVRGIAAMVEDGRYCIDILTQLHAARAALARIERDVLDDHAAACVAQAVASGDPEAQRAKLAELTELLRRALR
ncbi:metal-sensitive transcriptional regulator [uncultured Sphingomonas sp.]|uniref:metal-sensitive transcriptional regulator n=2 Tax=Sphingomonas TaxID=13687 RepID=UPI001574F270|nr:metal-sensitive transcriptional regulator [Sphingomonas bacterium]